MSRDVRKRKCPICGKRLGSRILVAYKGNVYHIECFGDKYGDKIIERGNTGTKERRAG